MNTLLNYNANIGGSLTLNGSRSMGKRWNKNFNPTLDLIIRQTLAGRESPTKLLARSLSVSKDFGARHASHDNNLLNISKQTVYFEYSPIYANLKDLINDKSKTTYERQIEIEKFMLSKWMNIVDNIKKDMVNNKMTAESFRLITEYIDEYIKSIAYALKGLKDKKIPKEKFAVYKFLYKMEIRDIAATVFNQIIPILSNPEGVKYNDLILKVGELTYRLWLYTEYEHYKNEIKKNDEKPLIKRSKSKVKTEVILTFKEFISDKQMGKDSYGIIGEFLIYNYLTLSDLIEKKLVNIEDTNKQEAVLIPQPKGVKAVENAFNVIGFKLPMIHKPAEWSEGRYGGYLLNQERYQDELVHKNSISGDIDKINNSLYDQVNFMNSVSYKINREMYDLITKRGVELGLIKDALYVDNNKDEIKELSDEEKAEVISHNSRYFQEKNILGLASLYSDVERFYLPLYFDWRGRIYNDIAYLNYQSISLAKSLILFEKGDSLAEEDINLWKDVIKNKDRKALPKDKFFYWLNVYGANCFGSGCFSLKDGYPVYTHKKGLDKLSFDDRAWWVVEHHDYIMSMDEKFWTKAADPILFAAFCLEYRNIYNGLQTKTYLPIQLDASCNGIQHLSIMSANSNLAKLVNLMPSDYCDEPYDLYSIVLDEINKKIVKLVEEDSKHILLKKLNLDRKLVKRSIMTIPYNVTLHGVVDHLQEFFKKEWKDKNLLYKPIDSKHGTGYITQSDIFKLAGIIRSTLFEMHPELNDLINYFKKMVDIFNQLNMPVVWKTPTGLKIKQKYLKTQSARIRSGYYRGASFNILIPTNKISKVSQKNSFMPNLIHSMDAATITHLISKMKKGMFCNIYTIHDCFATTACNIPQLNVLVRESFISLYADKSFVKSLHKLFIEYILGNYSVKHIDPDNNEEISILISSDNVDLDDILDHKFVVLTNDGSDPVLPKLPKLDEFTDLRNNIRKALYKIG